MLEDAASAWVEARLALDRALTTPGNVQLDSHALWAPLATQESRIALRLGGNHPIARAYSDAILLWAEAVNTAAQQSDANTIADKRNDAYDAHRRFLDLAAPYVGPEASDRPQLEAADDAEEPPQIAS